MPANLKLVSAPGQRKPDYTATIPQEMREQVNTWVLWQRTKDGRKIPDDWTHTPGAKWKGANDPALHLSFDAALAKLHTRMRSDLAVYLPEGGVHITRAACGHSGFLYCLDLDGFYGADADGPCWDKAALELWGLTRETYAEVSPSGTGLKLFFVADVAPTGKAVFSFGPGAFAQANPGVKKYQQREIEVFSRAYFLTVTGCDAVGSLQYIDAARFVVIMQWADDHGTRKAMGTVSSLAPLGFPVPNYLRGLSARADETTKSLLGRPPTQSAANVDIVKSYLSVLDAGCHYAEWVQVLFGIAAHEWDCGEELARPWSMTSSKYNETDFVTAWRSFDPNKGNYRALRSMAINAGWTPPVATVAANDTPSLSSIVAMDSVPTPSAPAPSIPAALTDKGWQAPKAFKLISRDDLHSRPALRWRIKGVLPERGLAGLYGPSTSGKSFLAFDMACAIAEGQPWFGHRVIAAPVVYVALEGEAGFRTRSQAWEQHHARKQPANFFMVLQPFNLIDEVDALANVVPPGAVVVIDTLNRAAPISDENSSKDMGAILEGAKRLQALTDGLVVVVHHTGKDATKGLRGHSSLFAALDAAIEVSRDEEYREWRVAKSKDGADGATHPFRLELKSLGQDEYGDGITSCVITPDTTGVEIRRAKLPQGGNQRLVLNALREALKVTAPGSPDAPDCVPRAQAAVALEAVLPQLADSLTCEKRRKTTSARTALNGLINRGVVIFKENWLWLS